MSPTRRRLLILLLALGLLVVLAGPAFAAEVVVTDEEGLTPETITVEVGESVDLVNNGTTAIRFMDDTGRWDSGPLAPGEVFSISFDAPGTMQYSSADGSLTGTIEVIDPGAEEGASETPAPSETAPAPTETATETPTEAATEAATEPEASETPTAAPTPTGSDQPTPGMADTGIPVVLLTVLSLGGLLCGAALLRRA